MLIFIGYGDLYHPNNVFERSRNKSKYNFVLIRYLVIQQILLFGFIAVFVTMQKDKNIIYTL